MSTGPDYIIEGRLRDIEGAAAGDVLSRPTEPAARKADPVQPAPGEPVQGGDPRPWIGVRFECCGVYHRIYRSPDGLLYAGRCPRCAKPVRVRVGRGGTNARFFKAE